jgi:hypothetical protein
LQKLDIGSSVAEFDTQLQLYFLETQIYCDFVNDRYDIVSGDKGTGKTAIYRIVRDRYRSNKLPCSKLQGIKNQKAATV